MQIFLIFVLILCCPQFICSVLFNASVFYECYRDWSRCTPATEFLTGILWSTCEDRCRELGRESGECVKADLGPCSGGYQCQCTGGKVKN